MDTEISFLGEHSVSETMIKTICDIIGEVSFRGTDSITSTSKEIARQREDYMKSYISEFLDEWDGIR